jgi:hypothetical protein
LRAANKCRPLASVICIAKTLKPFLALDDAGIARVEAVLALALFAIFVCSQRQPAS